MRAFLAIALPEDLHAALLDVQADLPGRPAPEENLHLTLAFLGDVTPHELEELHLDLSGRTLPGCDLAVTGLAGFGGRTPRVIAAEVAKSPALAALHRTVMGAVRAAGLDLPRARFRPHVTLTRLRPRPDPVERRKLDAALTALAGLHLPPVPAGDLGLCRSQLTPGGAIHHELAAYPLEAGPAG